MTALKRTETIARLLALPLLLSACASAPQALVAQAKPGTGAPAKAEKPHAVAPEAAPALPNVELTDKLLFEFLLGEVALQRGEPGLAAQAYLDLARSTRDPRVARRAAQIAFESHQTDRAIEAFKVWLELEPASQPARQMLISMLLSEGRLDEARPWLAQFMSAEPENAGTTLRQLAPLLARSPNTTAALKLIRDLAQPYPQLAEAHLAVAHVAAAAGKQGDALAETRRARSLRPDWDDAALFEVQLLQPKHPEEALAVLKNFLAANPKADDVRLLYARNLLDQKHYEEARGEFQRLLSVHPENADLAFAVAMLSLQLGELERAEKELRQALVNGKKDQDTVHYYLGQLAEAKKDAPGAVQHYHKVRGGEYAFPARLREAYLMSTLGKLEEARALLHNTRVLKPQQQAQLLLFEAQLLRDARQYLPAYETLQQGLQKFPDHPDMLYETGLLADKLGKPEVMEQALRRLINIQPDNANAYNALGYSFLERNVRVNEGMKLVEKAYQLAPNDAAIMDSLGWGHYRLGELEKSLEFLHRAYAANPDPEIAAHLGEVLWMHGDKEQAKQVWSATLKQHPESEPLQAVMKRFLQ